MFEFFLFIFKQITPQGAILISGVLGSCVALYAVHTSRKIARSNATVSLVTDLQSSERLDHTARAKTVLNTKSEDELKSLLEPVGRTDDQEKELKSLMFVLNTFEHLAVGVKYKAYDSKILKDNKYTTITRFWDKASPFVKKAREKSPTAYKDLEVLVKQWRNDPLTTNYHDINIKVPMIVAKHFIK